MAACSSLIPSVLVPTRRIVALVLLTLWLPATAHCGFEAAGFEALFGCATGHHASKDTDAHQDGCNVVEGGGFRSSAGVVSLPPPAFHVGILTLFAFVAELPLVPPCTGVASANTAPPELPRIWHFLVRAAPSPRAPSFVS